jgi:hypothetical protein
MQTLRVVISLWFRRDVPEHSVVGSAGNGGTSDRVTPTSAAPSDTPNEWDQHRM